MPIATVRKLSERRRTATRFDGHNARLLALEEAVEHHQKVIQLMRKGVVNLQIDVKTQAFLIGELRNRLPWWRRRSFTPAYAAEIRKRYEWETFGPAVCESIATGFENLGKCMAKEADHAGDSQNGERRNSMAVGGGDGDGAEAEERGDGTESPKAAG